MRTRTLQSQSPPPTRRRITPRRLPLAGRVAAAVLPVVMLLTLVTTTPLSAQEAGTTATAPQAAGEAPEGEEPQEEEPRVETPEEKFARISAPGLHHEHLGRQAGEWQTDILIWTAPDTEPIVAEGVTESRWILDGRFLETSFRGELFGEPFEGKGVEGYDNHAAKYVGTWRDNLGTLTLIFKGECTEDGTIRTGFAELTDPISGHALRNKGVTTFSIEEDTYTYESFLIAPDGTEFKNLEMTSRRK